MDKTIRAGLSIALATQRARLAYLGSIPGRAIKSTRLLTKLLFCKEAQQSNMAVLLQVT